MSVDKFLIGPFLTGEKTNETPWILPKDAFLELNNAYVWRDKLIKRFGSTYFLTAADTPASHMGSRLRMKWADATGISPEVFPPVSPANFIPYAIGQAFSIGDTFLTINALGSPAPLLSTSTTVSGTFDTTTGVLTITGNSSTDPVYFYPSLPVLGLPIYPVGQIINQLSMAFDSKFAYYYADNSGWERAGNLIWNGTDLNYPWTESFAGDKDYITALFVTNFNVDRADVPIPPSPTNDPMYYWVAPYQAPQTGTWTVFNPVILPNASTPEWQWTRLESARILIRFQNYLIAFNCVERRYVSGPENDPVYELIWYKNRGRWSELGEPLRVNSWYQQKTTDGTLSGVGSNFDDLDTQEEILSAFVLENRLIIQTMNGTWESVYLNDTTKPFMYQQISSELGSSTTFGTVKFDHEVVSIGINGIVACNGSSVERIDQNIPFKTFEIQNFEDNFYRTYAARDFFYELIYWAYPSIDNEDNLTGFPNKILVFNYRNRSWASFDDTITAFGYLEQSFDWTFDSLGEESFDSMGDATFNSGLQQSRGRYVIAGNQQGFTFMINQEKNTNEYLLQVTGVTIASPTSALLTVIAHNIPNGDYIQCENFYNDTTGLGLTGFDNNIFRVDVVTANVLRITVNDGSTTFDDAEVYAGGGFIARVSQVSVKSKWWNPYISEDSNTVFMKMNFGVETTTYGEFTVDYMLDSSEQSTLQIGAEFNSLLANGVVTTRPYDLMPSERNRKVVWHPLYMNAQGTFVQIHMYFKDDPFDFAQSQIRNPNIISSNFRVQGIVIHTRASSGMLR